VCAELQERLKSFTTLDDFKTDSMVREQVNANTLYNLHKSPANQAHMQSSQREVYIIDTLYNYCVILICVPCVSEETFFVQFNVCTKGGLVEPLGPPCVQA
jgi:hypothetical protein